MGQLCDHAHELEVHLSSLQLLKEHFTGATGAHGVKLRSHLTVDFDSVTLKQFNQINTAPEVYFNK